MLIYVCIAGMKMPVTKMEEKQNILKKFPCKCKILSMELLSIFVKYKDKKDFMMPLLEEINGKFGGITEQDVICIEEYFSVPEKKLNETIKSNPVLEIIPVKQHIIRVCNGESCKKCGSGKILNNVSKKLEIKPEEETPDGKFALKETGCVGLCEISPVIAIDNVFYGKINPSDASALIAHEMQKHKEEY